MLFKGDISKFHPADILMFLTNLGKEGLLTVTKDAEILNITIKEGFIVDAQSDASDEKILRTLLHRKTLDKNQYQHIRQVRQETHVPVQQIFEQVNLFPLSEIKDVLENGIFEVLFQFFLWETGQFQFADIVVDANRVSETLDCRRLAFEISRWVDEWQEIMRSLVSLDRVAALRGQTHPSDAGLSSREQVVLRMINGQNTLAEILSHCPFPSYYGLKAIEKFLSKGWLDLKALSPKREKSDHVSPAQTLFSSYKRTVRKILLSKDFQAKMAKLLTFCKDYFDQTLIITVRGHEMIRYMVFSKEASGALKRKDITSVRHDTKEDPVISWVIDTGNSFFGKVFPTSVFDGIISLPGSGECAVVFLGSSGETTLLLFALSSQEAEELTPFHYLELLSWLIRPPREALEPIRTTIQKAEPKKAGPPEPPAGEFPESEAARLVRTIEELPPMPDVVAELIKLLGDPNQNITDIIKVLSRDQSLVAKLIQVSNSALYGGFEKVSTIQQAISRLGSKTIRSIVLTASTRALFPMSQSGVGIWGRSLWQHSIECALASRRIAETTRYAEPEEAFLGGMFHDIGKLAIMLKLTDKYRVIRKKVAADKTSDLEAERAVIGFDHSEVGELLMKKWRMPPIIQECLRFHHQPEAAPEARKLIECVAYGNCLAKLYGSQTDQDPAVVSREAAAIIGRIGLNDEQNLKLTQAFQNDIQQTDIFD